MARRDFFALETSVLFKVFFARAACLDFGVQNVDCQSSDLSAGWQVAEELW